MTWQAYASTRPRFFWLAALSAVGLFACASPSTGDNGSGGGTGTGNSSGSQGGKTGGSSGGQTGSSQGGQTGGGQGGTTGGSQGGTTGGGQGGMTGGGTGGRATGGVTGGGTGGVTGGTGGMPGGCANTDMNVINEDSSGYVCNNKYGIKGAWYCYTDGSDTSAGNSCKGTNGKGAGAIPWNATLGAMCLAGTMGAADPSGNNPKFAGIGFKVNSGPPGSTAAPGTYNAGSLVGFAITLVSGPSGMGTNGMVLNLEFPTTTDMDTNSQDAPGVTLPGVGATMKTYNVLFADAVLANNISQRHAVDPANLTDVKLAFFPDSVPHTFDFCIKSVVPLTAAPPPVAAGPYGPAWNNQTGQAVLGSNGYAVQSAPFPMNGNPMSMQVIATATGVGFTYTPGPGFQSSGSMPGSFPAVISGWGPGEAGIQFYGPYKGGKTIGNLATGTVRSNWTFTMGTSGDAVYDVWFGNSATPTVPPAVELMVWIGNRDKNPIGSPVGSPVMGSDGVARQPYTGTNGTHQQVITYWVPQGTAPSGVTNFDLRPYFNDSVSRNVGLSTGSFLLGIQTGFEVYSGTWTTTDYSITIQ